MAKKGISIKIAEGKVLRQILKENKLEQARLALSIDISEGQLSNFLSGWSGMSPERVQGVYDVLKWDRRARFLQKYIVEYQVEHPDSMPIDFEIRVAQMRRGYQHLPPEIQREVRDRMDSIIRDYRPETNLADLKRLLKKIG